jgi:hypothetical protein
MKTILMMMALALPVVGAEKTAAELEQLMGAADDVTHTVTLLAGLLVYFVIFGALGMWLGEMRNRSREGAFLGVLLGPIGLVITMLMPEGQKREKAPRADCGSSGGGLAWRESKEARDWSRKSR